MKKKSKRKNRKEIMRRRRILKAAGAVFLVVVAVTLVMGMCDTPTKKTGKELCGVWVSYGDFQTLGLYNQNEADFRKNAELFLDDVQEYGINAVFFHTRAFRDAAYKSDNFPTASYLWDREEEIEYDALKIMIELAHERDIQLHAWLNPYRNRSFDDDILDPAEPSSTDEIVLCVEEIIDNYDVDGIHFDDYFYEEGNALEESQKKDNVNAMVREVYKTVHNAGRDLVFGISPAGNVSYCESIGADVETWLSEDGYVDYVAPQIYWTDEHTAPWRDKMFTDTLNEWISLNRNGAPLYIGLAMYKTGLEEEEDPGWINSDMNIAQQVEQIQENGCGGYIFFSASDFYREGAKAELKNYTNLVF